MKTILLLCSMIFITGCASMKIDEGQLVAPDSLKRPSHIYVKTFNPGSSWHGDFGNRSKKDFIAYELDRLNSRFLVQMKEVAPTSLAGQNLPSSGWLITGKLTHVDAGSGAARFWVGGFGVGAREVVADVQIFDLAKSKNSPIIRFRIDGGSRAEDGIMGGADDLNSDWNRIARETRNMILKRIQ